LTSNYLSRFQSGYLYHYAFAMLGGLVIILTWFIYY
jgi:NADH-quinone oxidoreductase subunit L